MKSGNRKVEFNIDTLMNNASTKKQVEGFIAELVLCRGKINQEREAIKDIVKEAKDSLGLPGKILNGLVAEAMNPGSIESKQHDIEEINGIAESLGMKD